MKLVKIASFVIIFILISLQNSDAQDLEKKIAPIKFLIGGALELGGDEVAKVYFTTGSDQSVNAGQGISIAVGTQIQIPKTEKLFVRATVGYKYVTTAADNAHIRLTRVPLILSGNFMAFPNLRLSVGVASHQAIQFKADGIGQDFEFESATGPVFEIAYKGVGLSYTAMEYNDQLKNSYSANAVGITFSVTLGKK